MKFLYWHDLIMCEIWRKFKMTRIIFLLFWILIISKDGISAEFTEKPRTCCKYSNKTECPDTRSCTLASSIANNIHPSNLEQCVVQLDSKKDKLQSQCSTGKMIFLLLVYIYKYIWPMHTVLTKRLK